MYVADIGTSVLPVTENQLSVMACRNRALFKFLFVYLNLHVSTHDCCCGHD